MKTRRSLGSDPDPDTVNPEPKRPCKRRVTVKEENEELPLLVTVKKENEELPMHADAAKEHIEEIRKERFWIGVGKNPLSKPLRMAVKYLSAELYSKDVHFLMELIQNAEDNEYPEGVEPSLEFIITAEDITGTRAPATLLVFNNEKGFSRRNMESICNVGDSTKAGNRKRGYIGEKGIGFKSVFLLTAQPYIFSNGYQIFFSEKPCSYCDIAYIVPEWVDSKPSLSDIQRIYGPSNTLPTTTLILPLKPEKVQVVTEQLSSLHPELLLFLSKVKRISVKEEDRVRTISISGERDFVKLIDLNAESYTIRLKAEEECDYYMWRQRFPVKSKNRVEKRMDIDEWAITLAFPYGERLNNGASAAGIFAFLPTEAVTNLPFIIQADFLLPTSRETILWENVWNEGMLDCVPEAFVNAFVYHMRTKQDVHAFDFLPLKTSLYPKLNVIREVIRSKLLEESIIPSESFSNQLLFHKPHEAGRLMSTFRDILRKAKSKGASLSNLSSEGKHVLHSSFDKYEYGDKLRFLGVEFVDCEWYPKCIERCDLVLGAGDDVFVQLLQFIAVNWTSHFKNTSMSCIPLLPYVNVSGTLSLVSVDEANRPDCQHGPCLFRSEKAHCISWLVDWSLEFASVANIVFMPKLIQDCCNLVDGVVDWLSDHANVKAIGVPEYALMICKSLKDDHFRVIELAHFVYHSHSHKFLTIPNCKKICKEIPIVTSKGGVSCETSKVFVPANGSKWVELMSCNPWESEGYVELSEKYALSGRHVGQFTPEKELVNFLQRFDAAFDIPDLFPLDSAFPVVSGPLTKQNALLLLEWITKLGDQIPINFNKSIVSGSWLRVKISGSPTYGAPSKSFLPSSSWTGLLKNGSNMVDLPLVDEVFYGSKIAEYHDVLKKLGVMSEIKEACQYISKHLMSLAIVRNLDKSKVLAMLHFIKFLQAKYLPLQEFVENLKGVEWVRTSCGYKPPTQSILSDQGFENAFTISLIPLIDQDYYGKEILSYKKELELLGVMVSLKGNFQKLVENVKSTASSLDGLTAEPLILALKCIRNANSPDKIIYSLKASKCLKTNSGYSLPGQCFLHDRKWGCILEVFEGFSYIDSGFYGTRIFDYKEELAHLDVKVEFVDATKVFCDEFKRRASANSLTKEHIFSFLEYYRKLRKLKVALPDDLTDSISKVEWLKTCLGDFRIPKSCILFSLDWQILSSITRLPFIDDKIYGNKINDYKDELKSMGVVVEFKKGSLSVLSHICFPQDPTVIPPGSVISLLQCIKSSKAGNQNSFPGDFLELTQQAKWLKTTLGYMSPQDCILFESNKKYHALRQEDGPFIDEKYYGLLIAPFKKELSSIGVIVDMSNHKTSSLIAKNITSHSEFSRIVRIYEFLCDSGFEAADEAHNWIWVPDGADGGKWAGPEQCVLEDADDLFGSRLHVLNLKDYKPKLLNFFSKVFKVKEKAFVDDYCELWKEWENSRQVISEHECFAFWRCVTWSMGTKEEKIISESLAKVPAVCPVSGEIVLVSKEDAFLPDDLLLQDLFDKSSTQPLFTWFPRKIQRGIARKNLFSMYSNLGVKKFSESVTISELCPLKSRELKRVKPKDIFIVKGLVMLVLGFLSDPEINVPIQKRLNTVTSLLNANALMSTKPITMTYSIKMSSGNFVQLSASRMVRWEREKSKFYAQVFDKSGGQKYVLEYATKFGEVISQGLLCDKEDDQISKLSDLIKVGFLMDFNEDAVSYLMKSKKLQLFPEDEAFLKSVYPPC